jgi:ABC-2 type transport system ATP-binding protein
MNAIEVHDLSKAFNGRKILDGISMAVPRGAIYGLLGPNGSGKTTTFRILLGLLRADSGEVKVLKLDPVANGEQMRQRVNALPESHGFYGWMRAGDYLRFFGQLYGLRLTAADCRKQLEQVGLDPNDRRPIRVFSRGMKQRLGIARSLLNDPEILLLDEPTNGLDPRGRREIHDLLLWINRERQATIMMSTHLLEDVDRLCNRIAILHDSKVRYEGSLTDQQIGGAVRYRFRVDDDKHIPPVWDFPGISLLKKEGRWLTCSLQNYHPASAIRNLIEHGLPIIEAEQISGGLESIYGTYTTGGAQ